MRGALRFARRALSGALLSGMPWCRATQRLPDLCAGAAPAAVFERSQEEPRGAKRSREEPR